MFLVALLISVIFYQDIYSTELIDSKRDRVMKLNPLELRLNIKNIKSGALKIQCINNISNEKGTIPNVMSENNIDIHDGYYIVHLSFYDIIRLEFEVITNKEDKIKKGLTWFPKDGNIITIEFTPYSAKLVNIKQERAIMRKKL